MGRNVEIADKDRVDQDRHRHDRHHPPQAAQLLPHDGREGKRSCQQDVERLPRLFPGDQAGRPHGHDQQRNRPQQEARRAERAKLQIAGREDVRDRRHQDGKLEHEQDADQVVNPSEIAPAALAPGDGAVAGKSAASPQRDA